MPRRHMHVKEAHAWQGGTCMSRRHMHAKEAHACQRGTCMSKRHMHGREAHACQRGTCMAGRHMHVKEAHAWQGGRRSSFCLIALLPSVLETCIRLRVPVDTIPDWPGGINTYALKPFCFSSSASPYPSPATVHLRLYLASPVGCTAGQGGQAVPGGPGGLRKAEKKQIRGLTVGVGAHCRGVL